LLLLRPVSSPGPGAQGLIPVSQGFEACAPAAGPGLYRLAPGAACISIFKEQFQALTAGCLLAFGTSYTQGSLHTCLLP